MKRMNNLATSPFVLLTRVIYVFWFILSASCSTQATSSAGENELSNQKKYFKNIQASILYPEGLQEIESEFSYTFTDNNDYIYIASVYINQNIEQVKQTVVGNLSQNGFIITLENNFASNNKGLTVANASVEYAGNTFPGYLILKKIGRAHV